MTAPQGGLASFGANNLFKKPYAGRQWLIDGQGTISATAQTVGSLRLYPFYNPFPVACLGLGHIVTVAGAVGSTITPVIYALNANGDPGVPFVTGAPLIGDAIGTPIAALAFTLPVGWWWGGGLTLVGAPTCMTVLRAGGSPWGAFAPCDNLATQGNATLGFQTGLGGIPNPYAGTYISGSAPALVIQT